MQKAALLLFLLICFSSCVAVKEYDRAYLNDDEMLLSTKKSQRFENNFQVYREGASGGDGGKTGGGCGCN